MHSIKSAVSSGEERI